MHRAVHAALGGAPRPAGRAPSASSQYKETEVLSATPGRLVILLYEHLEVCLRRAHIAMQAGQVEPRVMNLAKSRAIISELLGTLDFEAGGSLAAELSQLYAFLLRELVDVGIKQDGPRLLKLVEIVQTLGEGFRDAVTQVESAATPATAVGA